jgi:hypothetical protein
MLYLRVRSFNHQLQLLVSLKVKEVCLFYIFLSSITRWNFNGVWASIIYNGITNVVARSVCKANVECYVLSMQTLWQAEQDLPVVHVSVAFVVHRHDVQEHDVRGCWVQPTQSHLDRGEHPPTGDTRKQHGQRTAHRKHLANLVGSLIV